MVRSSPQEAYLPTVLLAAVHHLILSDLEHPLANVYAGSSDRDPGPIFVPDVPCSPPPSRVHRPDGASP